MTPLPREICEQLRDAGYKGHERDLYYFDTYKGQCLDTLQIATRHANRVACPTLESLLAWLQAEYPEMQFHVEGGRAYAGDWYAYTQVRNERGPFVRYDPGPATMTPHRTPLAAVAALALALRQGGVGQ